MKQKDGKYLEYLVQLLEKSLSPNSIVEHDVNLPILSSRTGETTQCDIVIRSGEKHRETLTIVEVQDRTSQVKPNDFRGWQKKLEEVGAQHLYCVSRKEFPKSVKEKALYSGNTVRLITLKELPAEEIPFGLFKSKFQHYTYKLTALHKVAFWVSKSDEKLFNSLKGKILKEADNKFSLNKESLISLKSLFLSMINQENEIKGRCLLKQEPTDTPNVYYKIDEKFVRVGLEVDFEWQVSVVQIPTSILSYGQYNHGTLAWVIDGVYESPDGLVGWKFPLTKSGNSWELINLMHNSPYKEWFIEIRMFPDYIEADIKNLQ